MSFERASITGLPFGWPATTGGLSMADKQRLRRVEDRVAKALADPVQLPPHTDWIDRIAAERPGIKRPLLQSQHAEVNARYPGCTLEYCCDCSQPTGAAGKGEDSLYDDDDGPYCRECWSDKFPDD